MSALVAGKAKQGTVLQNQSWTLHRNYKKQNRKAFVAVLTVLLLPVLFAFLAYGIDTSMIAAEKSKLQNAVDAAALAASQDITTTVDETTSQDGATVTAEVTSIAQNSALATAFQVAAMNNATIDPVSGIQFGSRQMTADLGDSEQWEIAWDQGPYNAVKVSASKEVPLLFGMFIGQPSITIESHAISFVSARDLVVVLDYSGSMTDGSRYESSEILGVDPITENQEEILESFNLPEGTFGTIPEIPEFYEEYREYVTNKTDSIDAVNKGQSITLTSSKDLSNVVVIYCSKADLEHDVVMPLDADGEIDVIALLAMGTVHEYKYDDLPGGSEGVPTTFEVPGGISDQNDQYIIGCFVKAGANQLEINLSNNGYGQYFDFSLEAMVDAYGLVDSNFPEGYSGTWREFLFYCLTDSEMGSDPLDTNNELEDPDFLHKFGQLNFVSWRLAIEGADAVTPNFNDAPVYPFQAMKDGVSVLCNFLNDLQYGDHLGVVSYASEADFEDYLSEADNDGDPLYLEIKGPNDMDLLEGEIDLTADPVNNNFAAINTIIRHRQASYSNSDTSLGQGILKGKSMSCSFSRSGAQRTMLIMTDGNANHYPEDWTGLPAGWDWANYTDYDDSGTANYSTDDPAKQYAFYQAVEAKQSGITLHTMSIGDDADRLLMFAIAFMGGGQYIDVPEGTSIPDMEDELRVAFGKVASNVPIARLTQQEISIIPKN